MNFPVRVKVFPAASTSVGTQNLSDLPKVELRENAAPSLGGENPLSSFYVTI